MKKAILLVAGIGVLCAPVVSACGGSGGNDSGFVPMEDAAADGTRSTGNGDSGSSLDATLITDSGTKGFGDGSTGCPSTCKELGANCGATTDTKCGGVVQCGSCPAGQLCGGGGKANVCGTGNGGDGGSLDGCSPMTCASQKLTCGQAGDGCGGTLQCGTCALPQTCGGDPTHPGQCGCTGICQMIPTCDGGGTTTLTGTVLDPAGLHPLYNALVYVPNNPSDPGLQPFPAGISCDVCGATAAGDPLVTAYTAPDGTFTLTGVPVGASIPLVIQLGRWRRQFTVDVATACGTNAVPAGTLTMPKNHTEGDIPRIAILTGGFDPIECVLRKMGVQDTEFTDPGGAGHVQFYLASQANLPPNPLPGCTNPYGSGAQIDGTTPGQAALFGTGGGGVDAGTPTINQYDLTLLACEGYEEDMQADWPNLGAYTAAGGRVFMTDYSYDWIAHSNNGSGTSVTQNPAYTGVATWDTDQNPGGSAETGTIDLTSNPQGMAFQQWLQDVGVSKAGSGTVSLNPVFHNSDAVIAPTQQWLYWGASTPIHFTFNTPVGAASAAQCGRGVYSDWHADTLNLSSSVYGSCPWGVQTGPAPYYSHGMTFPTECDSNPMTAQETILEFMLFDLSACVQPYQPVCTPTTCAKLGVDCGPASDGCGNLLSCGSCATGQTCGGGGAGKCGTQTTCTPETCTSQGIQCGQAGDGCGKVINCGNCPTGEICGYGGPGKCGSTQ